VAWTTAAADKETPYSNTAAILGVFAPAHNAYTTARGGAYTSNFGGTSAASPYAAGAAAVLQNAAKVIRGTYLTPGEIRDTLIATGDPVTTVKFNYSKNRVNLERAVNSLFAGSPEPVPALNTSGIMFLLLLVGVVIFRIGKFRRG
jgi:subtilisin family serine protease